MRFVWKKSILSREQVAALTPGERAQLIAGARDIIACHSLDAVVAWCDAELCGWLELAVEDDDGRVLFDAWALTGGDNDCALFEPGMNEPNGIGISQDLVSDGLEHRDALCAQIQAAWDAFEKPPFEEWARGA
jgi:hypothetical protein